MKKSYPPQDSKYKEPDKPGPKKDRIKRVKSKIKALTRFRRKKKTEIDQPQVLISGPIVEQFDTVEDIEKYSPPQYTEKPLVRIVKKPEVTRAPSVKPEPTPKKEEKPLVIPKPTLIKKKETYQEMMAREMQRITPIVWNSLEEHEQQLTKDPGKSKQLETKFYNLLRSVRGIMDINMPGKDGRTMLDHVRNLGWNNAAEELIEQKVLEKR